MTGNPLAATLLLVMPLPPPSLLWVQTLPLLLLLLSLSPSSPAPCHHAIPITMTITRRLGTIEQYAGRLSPSAPLPPAYPLSLPLLPQAEPFPNGVASLTVAATVFQHQINRFHCAVGIQLDFPQAPSFDSSTLLPRLSPSLG